MSGSFSRPLSSAQPAGVVENPVFSPPIQSDATTSSTVSMPFVRRHVTRRLKAAKADCDRELRQVIYSITSLFEERCEGEQNGDIDHHDRDKDVDRGSQHSDFDDVRELFAVTRPASPADDSAYDVKCDYRHSRQLSRSPSSLRVPSGSSTAKDSTSESPSLFPPTTNRGSAATSTSVNRTSSPILINDPTDPLIFALYGLIGIATDVTEMSIAQLEAQPNICVPLVRRVQDIGNTWDHYPDRPGRRWYVQVLLAIASLSRVVEWWEAEKLFWGFGNAYDEAIEHTRALLESMPMGDPRRRPTLLELSSRLRGKMTRRT
ncbi:hypothetical protein M404DRAFT_685902 [Pisolithus tinctorius Marx 270]|uniref:Uncharacterized protein n=1 Tax=Pisolithus tinctorius Marx 270 TaxID=870435 RepID=A0A0C3KSX0_PISTI|nr:hypothetical protein M404DRAFT_685902 [Pisolithus tinctorius Marx 270]